MSAPTVRNGWLLPVAIMLTEGLRHHKGPKGSGDESRGPLLAEVVVGSVTSCGSRPRSSLVYEVNFSGGGVWNSELLVGSARVARGVGIQNDDVNLQLVRAEVWAHDFVGDGAAAFAGPDAERVAARRSAGSKRRAHPVGHDFCGVAGIGPEASGAERRARGIPRQCAAAWAISRGGDGGRVRSGERGRERGGEHSSGSLGHAEAGGGGSDGERAGARVVDYGGNDRYGERGAPRGGERVRLAECTTRASQLCQHRLHGSGNGAGGAVGSDQGAYYGGVVRRKLGAERGVVCGWRRQHRRLHWRVPAEFFAGCDPGIRGAHRAGGSRYRADSGRVGGDHDQAWHQRVAWQRGFL